MPIYQKRIIATSNRYNKRIFVATNLLESMVENSLPSRAEVSDVYHILSDGANGLVLAAETAIGEYPVECAKMIDSIINEYYKDDLDSQNQLDLSPHDWLIEPHGGELVQRISNNDEKANLKKLNAILRIKLSRFQKIQSIFFYENLLNY